MSNGRPYVELGDLTTVGELLVRTQLRGRVGVVLVVGNPDGLLAAGARGQLAIDITTGTIYQATSAGSSWSELTLTLGAQRLDPLFGLGFDGPLTFDGSTTVVLADGSTIVPAAGVYTLPVGRDVYPTSCLVDGAARVKLNGQLLAGVGTLTCHGIVDDDGADAVGNTAGAARATTSRRFGGGAVGGSAGGSGGSSAPPPGLFSTLAGIPTPLGQAGVTGGKGQGGSGGSSGGQGGAPGGVTPAGATNGVGLLPHELLRGAPLRSTSIYSYGSGGGAGNQSGTLAGAGGAGGGFAAVAFPRVEGSGRIGARGGRGGDCTGSNSGGGGGGGGGLTMVLFRDLAGSLTIDAAGGAPGVGLGTGRNGGSGGAGHLALVPLR